jgi:aldose sugar dehydrogenase
VKGTPVPWVRQDGGFFDIAVDPEDKNRSPWIYLAYSEVLTGYKGALPPPGPLKDGARLPPSMTRIVRAHLNANGEWVDQQDIFKAPDRFYTPSVIHYGSRFLFDHKGHLFFTIGERGDMTNAQRLDTPLGKIHRVNDDGSNPTDNPFVHTPGAVPSIWSYGHRNSEGLSLDPATGILWESEHGPTGGDEINIIEKGHNYGWGVVSMGLQPGITRQHQKGMDDPITYYSPAIGPSGITFNTGGRYSAWKDNLFLTALVGQKLFRYEIVGRKITHQEILWDQYGRTRDVIMGPNGLLYVLLQNATGAPMSTDAATPGMVVRLVPVNN